MEREKSDTWLTPLFQARKTLYRLLDDLRDLTKCDHGSNKMCHPLMVDFGRSPVARRASYSAGACSRACSTGSRAPRPAPALSRRGRCVPSCTFWAKVGLWPHMFDFFAKPEGSGEILTTGRCRSRPRAREFRMTSHIGPRQSGSPAT